MANKVWVFGSDGDGNYSCVIHTPMVAGNNSAGVSWQNVIIALGLNVTILPVGANSWQQLQAEHDAVVAGTTLEVATILKIDTANANSDNVTSLVQQFLTDWEAKFGVKYAWYGYNQAA